MVKHFVFNKQLKDKVKVENFKSLSAALRRIFES